MKKMFSYDDYMLEKILESVNADELKLLISKKLNDILVTIKSHPIALNILQNSNTNANDFKVTFIDIDDSDTKKKDMISFLVSNKAISLAAKSIGAELKRGEEISDTELNTFKVTAYTNQNTFYNTSGRSITKIGRLVGKLFPNQYKQSGDPGKDIESFVNMYKAARDTSKFEIVKGDKIAHWYNEEQYVTGGGSMNNSCMRYGKCKNYLEFYTENEDKVSLVILKDTEDDKKIRGRAILWELESPSGRTFMDRIYTSKDSDIILFQDYAKENGWLHKKYQNMDGDGPWIDTKNGEKSYIDLVVDGLEDPGDGGYPYMDTMKYFDGDTISNDKDYLSEPKKLESTSGDAQEAGEWSDFYNEYIDIEGDDMIYCERGDGYRYDHDCFYSEFYGESIADDYAERYMTDCDLSDDGDSWRDDSDYVETHEGHTATNDYAENNLTYSEYHNEWLEESVWSDYMDDHISEDDAVEVYTDVEGSDTDWRVDDPSDGHYWKWEHDDEKYSNDITEAELREYHDLDEDED